MTTRRLLLIALVAALSWGCPQKPASPEAPASPKAETKTEKTKPKAEAPPAKPKAEEAKTPAKAIPSFPDNMAPGETKNFGTSFTIEGDPKTLASSIATVQGAAKKGAGEVPVKIRAQIDSVCQVKGCWMVLKEEGSTPVRVRMKDYSFFVPKNVKGATAVVEGVLTERVVPQKEAQHYADDEAKATGKPAKKIAGDQKGFQLMASAITVTMPPKS